MLRPRRPVRWPTQSVIPREAITIARALSRSGCARGCPSSARRSGPASGSVRAISSGQGVHALGQVLPRRLLQLAVTRGDIKDVIADLEHHAEAAPELGVRADLAGRQATRERADPARRCGQRCRSALIVGEVVLATAPDLKGRTDLGGPAPGTAGPGCRPGARRSPSPGSPRWRRSGPAGSRRRRWPPGCRIGC